MRECCVLDWAGNLKMYLVLSGNELAKRSLISLAALLVNVNSAIL
jgi:hypothetical protein